MVRNCSMDGVVLVDKAHDDDMVQALHAAERVRNMSTERTLCVRSAHEYEKCHVNKFCNYCFAKRSAWLRSSSMCP